MAAKLKLHLLQVEVENDEQWKKDVRERPGLSVVDVYPGWVGPCIAMRDQLIRLKLVEGGDNLHLFTANASNIKALARFNEHSEPTWMILGSGKLVNLYIGCNCPEILRMVRSELRRELRVMEGKATRKAMPLNKPTPAEQRRQGRLNTELHRERRALEAQRRAQQRAARTRAYHRLAAALRGCTVVLFLPHSLNDDGSLPTVADSLRNQWRDMGLGVTRTVTVDVTAEMADDIFWERRLPQHRELVESLLAGPSQALLVARLREQDLDEEPDPGARGDAPAPPLVREEEEEEELELGQIEHIIAESIYGFYPGSPDSEGSSRYDSSPSEFFSPVGPSVTDLGVVGDQFRLSASSWLRRSSVLRKSSGIFEHEDEQEDSPWLYGEGGGSSTELYISPGAKELRPVVDSAAAMLLKRDKVTLPGVWTPLSPLGKAAAVRALFTSITDGIYQEDPIPPPPPAAWVIVFRAYKRNNAWKAMSSFADEVIHYGFFTEDKLRLASTMDQYEQLGAKEPRDRLVVALASTRSAPLLALAEVGASYISPNVSIAKKDLQEYFSASVREAEPRQPQEAADDEEPTFAEQLAVQTNIASRHEGGEEAPNLSTTSLGNTEAVGNSRLQGTSTSLKLVQSVTRVQSVSRVSMGEQESLQEIGPDVNETYVSSFALVGDMETSVISVGRLSSSDLEVQPEL